MANTSSFAEKDFQKEFDKEKIESFIRDLVGKGIKFTYTIKKKHIDAYYNIGSILFLDISYDENETISTVLKFMKEVSVKKKFKNEIFMYKSIINTMSDEVKSIFPRLVYASPVSDYNDMMIGLEDLTQIGFRMSPRKVLMDLEEIRISLKALGKLHAEMYTMKFSKPEKFTEAIDFINLNNAHALKNDDPFSLLVQKTMRESAFRTFERLIRNYPQNNKIRALYSLIQRNGMKEMCLRALEPEEPIAVICHGDFNRNNLMFRYEDGVPVECKIIDLQFPCYGSPTIDIGFILFMNMESSDRVKHWNSLWKDYYDALQERLRINMGDHFVIPSFLSFDSLQDDFNCKNFLCFISSIYFTHVNFCDTKGLCKFIREYFEIDETDEELRIKHICKHQEKMEIEEVIRITDELTMEYLEHHESFLINDSGPHILK